MAIGPGSDFRAPRFVTVSVALAIAFATPALAAPVVGDQSIVASLNAPPAGLNCDEAAAQTSVYFHFAHPQFAVKQLTLYLNGQGVPKESIEQHWPTVTLLHGLHPGRNTVEIVASSDSGQTMTRQLTVLVGAAADANDASPAFVQCAGSTEEIAEEPAYSEEIVEPERVVEEPVYVERPVVYDDVYYDDGPVYVYHRYPTVVFDPFIPIIPFFAFSVFYSNYHPYCPPPRWDYHRNERQVAVNNYYGDGRHDGWRGGDWHGGRPDRSSNFANSDAHFHHWSGGDGWRGHDQGRHEDHHFDGRGTEQFAHGPSQHGGWRNSPARQRGQGPERWGGRSREAQRGPSPSFSHHDAPQMPRESRAPFANAGRPEGRGAMHSFHGAERSRGDRR